MKPEKSPPISGECYLTGDAQSMFNTAREHHLPELNVAGAEGAGAGVQIIGKHAFETLRIVIGNFRPAGEETLIPAIRVVS